MANTTQPAYDLVLLGATGFTGRLALERMTVLADRGRRPEHTGPRWAVAGRDRRRLRSALDEAGTTAGVLEVDLTDHAAVRAVVEQTRVVLNVAGPYTSTAEPVIAACAESGTHYADLSGELPFLRRIIDRHHHVAERSGAQIVQLAGWEALAPDLVALHAARAATGAAAGEWGPGTAHPVVDLTVISSFETIPADPSGGPGLSAGTMRSILEIVADADAGPLIGDPAGLLPRQAPGRRAVRERSPMRYAIWQHDGRLIGPQTPVAILNPPAVHRTAALLAEDGGRPHAPARFREGSVLGPAREPGSWTALPRAVAAGAGQRGIALASRLPTRFRKSVAAVISRRLPRPGTGPSNQDGWRWTLRAEALTSDGARGAAELTGTRHPGYGSTADMLVALGLRLATADRDVRPGCVTPALAFGPELPDELRTPELNLTIVPS